MTRITKAPDERRLELIKAAQLLFFAKGYEKTSINDIVKQVGVAKGLFYYYFDTKQAILLALVEEMTAQVVAMIHVIVEDPTLPALQKWKLTHDISSAWKLARKDELMGLLRVLMADDNVRLLHTMIEQQRATIAPEYAKIIAQGVEEGVFETPFVEDSAEIILNIYASGRSALADILLNPNDHPNGRQLVEHKLRALHTAVERVVGAQSGKLSEMLIDEHQLDEWF